MMLLMPILIPMFAAALSMIIWRHRTLQRWVSVVTNSALLIAALILFNDVYNNGIQVTHLGGWEAPFGISLVADLLAVIMVTVSAFVAFCIAIYALATMNEDHEKFGFYPLLHLMLAGVIGAFLTGDIFNLYVWFEIMLVASFGLLILGGEREQMEGALKYVTLNLLSSALFLSAVGLLYSYAGTLNMADLGSKLSTSENAGVITVISLLFLVAFGIKAAAFPLFFWLPASYHTPPVAISAVFAGLLTKVGVYALYRVFSVIFVGDIAFTHHTLLLWMGILTMITGVLGAAAQFEVRRILSFHIVSQIGYMLVGLALFTPLAITGGIFYLFHHIIVKTNLFLISGVINRRHGTNKLDKLGGLYKSAPVLSILFAIPAMSLAGIPPLSGFFAKYVVIKAGLDTQAWLMVVASLAVGLLTLYSMIKIWSEAFWKPLPNTAETKSLMSDSERFCMYFPIILMAGMTITIGLYAEWFIQLASMAAEQVMNPQVYIDAVLGGQS
ncbi:Na+/H+ antiporter subunit D [Vibrio sp. V33_P6A3T137]|uniref:Na+/H+ antiporter subunit D n=1 Tax=Vibrio sp. V33_P6A3T137 TaxID=1938685 RepID=UPI00137352EF|nr:Na+/H+ antiporter subunit D [Vibrio sp. V33_P6A3T137]NAW79900.1 Na+/H+ antiporter subunit D [Vibrio sp. V33_P6A3T137]